MENKPSGKIIRIGDPLANDTQTVALGQLRDTIMEMKEHVKGYAKKLADIGDENDALKAENDSLLTENKKLKVVAKQARALCDQINKREPLRHLDLLEGVLRSVGA